MKNILSAFILSSALSLTALAQFTVSAPVLEAITQANQAQNAATSTAQHADTMAQWAQQIQQATQTVNKLNDTISHLSNVEGLIGMGMQGIGIDPSVLQGIDLGKSLMTFGNSIQSLQQNSLNNGLSMESQLMSIRNGMNNPTTWTPYVINARSYDQNQKTQMTYDQQKAQLDAYRKQMQDILKNAGSLLAAQKAQAAIDAIDKAQQQLDEERKRTSEQLNANYINTQNQKDAYNQALNDYNSKEMDTAAKNAGAFGKAVVNQ